jgi:hypothetical protein
MNIVDAVRKEFKSLFQAHLEEAASTLASVVWSQSPALQSHCSEETTHANFLAMAYASCPRCEVLDSEEENIYLFRITSPATGSCLGVILGNDTNASRHIGQNGTTQSNAIIGICTDAVMRGLGGELLEVNPLSFRKPIPLEKPVVVKITLTRRSKLTIGTIAVTREYDGEIVLKKAILKMTLRNNN